MLILCNQLLYVFLKKKQHHWQAWLPVKPSARMISKKFNWDRFVYVPNFTFPVYIPPPQTFVLTQSDSSKILLILIHFLVDVLNGDNLIQLIDLGRQPISIDVERLDKGCGIVPTLIQPMQNSTKRAKTCSTIRNFNEFRDGKINN